MSDSSNEKTEKATPKKRQDARKEGQVLKSQDLVIAACAMAVFGFMLAYSDRFVEGLTKIISSFLDPGFILSQMESFDEAMLPNLFSRMISSAAGILLPLFAVTVVIAVVSNVAQVGFMFTGKAIQPKASKINPLKGFKRMFSMQSIVQMLKSILKILLLGIVFYNFFKEFMLDVPSLMFSESAPVMSEIFRLIFNTAVKMGGVMLGIGILDFFYQWYKYEKDLKMTKQEIKDEYKTTEGDPQIKGRIRQKQREMSQMRMMDSVPTADVVITNPTHFAVALRYKEGTDKAPTVVAKGQDYIARKIKERARESGVEIVEDKPLARSLFSMCEVGQEIPTELYQAVADILVFVYRQKQR